MWNSHVIQLERIIPEAYLRQVFPLHVKVTLCRHDFTWWKRCLTVQCNLKVLDRSTSSVAPRSLPLLSPMNTGLSNTINSLSTRLRKSWQNERYGNLLQRTITFRYIIANYAYTWSNCTLISSSSEEENWFAIPILFSLQAAKSQLRQNETRERYLFPLPQLSQAAHAWKEAYLWYDVVT